MSSPRANRVPERIKEILAELVGQLKDPRIGFVTITDVRTTTDFGHATAYYTVLGARSDAAASDWHTSPAAPGSSRQKASAAQPLDRSDEAALGDELEQRARERTAVGLASATPLLRRELGSRLRLRQVPTLRFVHDPLPEHGRRIDALLEVAKERISTSDEARGVRASASEPAGGDPGVRASASEPAGGDPRDK